MVHLRSKKIKRGAAAGRALLTGGRTALFRAHDKRGRRATAVLLLPAFLWIFTQLVMSGFIQQPSMAQAEGLRVITICSGTELTTLIIDANGNPVKDIPTKTVSCPWCAQFGGVGPVPMPYLALIAAPSSIGRRITVPQGDLIIASLSYTPYASRAPPSSTNL